MFVQLHLNQKFDDNLGETTPKMNKFLPEKIIELNGTANLKVKNIIIRTKNGARNIRLSNEKNVK